MHPSRDSHLDLKELFFLAGSVQQPFLIIYFCLSLPSLANLRFLSASIVRVVSWSLEPGWVYTATKWQLFLHSLLFALPPMLLVSTYTILVRPHRSFD
jgi:uncharacterized membrane protein